MLVSLGDALRTLPNNKCKDYVTAIISTVEVAVTKLLGDGADQPEHMNCVLDVGGTRIMQATSSMSMMKKVISALTNNYPARLAGLYVVDLPMIAQWILQALMPFMHPVTRKKVALCSATDRTLPIDLAAIKSGSQGVGGRSDASGAVEESSGSRVSSSSNTLEEPMSPFEAPPVQSSMTSGMFTPRGLPSLRRGPLAERKGSAAQNRGLSEDAGSVRRRLHQEPEDSASAQDPAIPPLDLQEAEHQHTLTRVHTFTPRSVNSNDLTTVIYFFIAIAGCSFLSQQAGISPQQVMQTLQKYIVWMTKTLQLD